MKFNWEWVVPIIVAIFYVIGHIVKAREEQEAKANPKPAGPRGNTELDRFLEEIERLRRERAGMSQKEYEEQQEEYEEEEQRPVTRPIVVQTPTIVMREPARTYSLPEPIRPAVVIPPILKIADRPILSSTAPTFRRSRSVAATMALLRNPQSLATAIVLREIFGPPKCRK
jgi:hypothetical protein